MSQNVLMRPLHVVIDTNVVFSAMRSGQGASFQILRLLGRGLFTIAVSVPLVLEYEATAKHNLEELPFDSATVEAIIDFICAMARAQDIHFRWRPMLRDPGDEMVLELAVAAGCDAIVTFNKRDFQGAEQFGLRLLTPAELLYEIGLAK